jgi:hypothetical protein
VSSSEQTYANAEIRAAADFGFQREEKKGLGIGSGTPP